VSAARETGILPGNKQLVGFTQHGLVSLVFVFHARSLHKGRIIMEYIDQQFEAFANVFDILEIVQLGFLILIVVETAWDFCTKKRAGISQTLANYMIATGNHFLDRTFYGLIFILGLFLTEAYAFVQIPEVWWSWIFALLVADLTYYWMHRLEHEVRILWAWHSVHHSSPEFNLTTGLRLAWIEGVIEWIFFVPMILIGFSAIQTVIALSIVVIYQTWIHTDKIGKLGWADRIFNTPSIHRVHHGSNRQYHDKNYGGILILWDRLFGTYSPEEEKVVYGIARPVGTWNPLMINTHEFWHMSKDIWRAKSLGDALRVVFRGPSWRAKDSVD
jgi:sterol desaturase/sphingolipid hydroxylase (fatty acid hydroxylase superfamily)